MSVEFTVHNLRETYHEQGRYEFKVVMNPRYVPGSTVVRMVDPAGNEMPCDVKHWGRKIRVGFKVDGSIPDGVVTVYLTSTSGECKMVSFWVIQ